MAKANNTANSETAAVVKVTLIMPHTHGGTDYAVGDQIDVTEAQKAWLEQRAVIATDPKNPLGE